MLKDLKFDELKVRKATEMRDLGPKYDVDG